VLHLLLELRMQFKYRLLLLGSICVICLGLYGCTTTRQVPIEQEIVRKKLFIDINVQSPSMIQYDERYYLFHSGSGISNWVSRDRVNWIRLSPVFDTHPNWALPYLRSSDQVMTAPRISRINNQLYLLYTVHDSDSLGTATGLATNMSLRPSDPNYKWVDRGIIYQAPGGQELPGISSASLFVDDSGVNWITAGVDDHLINIARIDEFEDKSIAKTADYDWQTIASSVPLRSSLSQSKSEFNCNDLNGDDSLSAQTKRLSSPQLLSNGDYYYLFFTRWSCEDQGLITPFVNVGRSEKVRGPYRDSDGRFLTDGGGTAVIRNDSLKKEIGESTILTAEDSHFLVSETVSHDNSERSILAILEISWIDGWPVIDLDQ